MVMTEAMEIDRTRSLPLSDRPRGADVDVALDRVAVVERDLKPVEIDDVQVSTADLPVDVVSRFVSRHHLVEVLLVTRVLFGGTESDLVGRPAVIADGRRDDHLVGQVRRPVDDPPEPLASPADGRHRLQLGEFRLILVDRV